jgi:nitroreductase
MKDALDVIEERRSVRKYKSGLIAENELEVILDAGTWAPTGTGSQSPVIVVTTNPELIARLERLNAAVIGKADAKPFYGAQTLVTVFADMSKPTPIQDASLVMGNMMLAARTIGVGSCWINRAKQVFESDEGKTIKADWGLGDNWEGVAHCILGYADEAPKAAPRKIGYIKRID